MASAVVILILVTTFSGTHALPGDHVGAAAIPLTSRVECNTKGEALAAQEIQKPGVKRVLWRCETADEGYDAPVVKPPPCDDDENECRGS